MAQPCKNLKDNKEDSCTEFVFKSLFIVQIHVTQYRHDNVPMYKLSWTIKTFSVGNIVDMYTCADHASALFFTTTDYILTMIVQRWQKNTQLGGINSGVTLANNFSFEVEVSALTILKYNCIISIIEHCDFHICKALIHWTKWHQTVKHQQ